MRSHALLKHFFPDAEDFSISVADPYVLGVNVDAGETLDYPYTLIVDGAELARLLDKTFSSADVKGFLHTGPRKKIDRFIFGVNTLCMVDPAELAQRVVEDGFYVLTKGEDTKIVCFKSPDGGRSGLEFGVGEVVEVPAPKLWTGEWAGYTVEGRIRAFVQPMIV